MNIDMPTPTDRVSFDSAMAEVISDHATLRRLAAVASGRPSISTDDILSMSETMATHERVEARLFALPFLTHPPEIVTTTAARARQRCQEFVSGDFRLPNSNVAAALFIEALLAHLAAEDSWLANEKEHHSERLRSFA